MQNGLRTWLNSLDPTVGEKVASESLSLFNGLAKRSNNTELVALATVAEPLKQYLLDLKHPVLLEKTGIPASIAPPKRGPGRPRKVVV